MFLRKSSDAEASIVGVEMIARRSYGAATVRIRFRVEPAGEAPFEAPFETGVEMRFLPQAGQRVDVRYDPATREVRKILTAAGEERGTPLASQPTVEIPWVDSARQGYVRPDGTRGYR
jgi:hypothetical protein